MKTVIMTSLIAALFWFIPKYGLHAEDVPFEGNILDRILLCTHGQDRQQDTFLEEEFSMWAEEQPPWTDPRDLLTKHPTISEFVYSGVARGSLHRRSFQSCYRPITPEDMETAWVSHYASGLLPSQDVATAIAVDGAGNVYVTGYSSNPPFGMDYITVKYGPTASLLWAARYNGDGNDDDFARAVHVDRSGNVYVTGTSWGGETGADYATVKYNSEGVQLWVARYNGPEDSMDEANALVTDTNGNVYVTGNAATIKYNEYGRQEWMSDCTGDAIILDNSGNVCVTGENEHYTTVKFGTDGIRKWMAHFGGQGGGDNVATAMVGDDDGNVYLTGYCYDTKTLYDYVTMKYNSSGEKQWTSRYNGPENSYDKPTALAVDDSGNVYVTGKCGGTDTGTDYVTIKYDAGGIQQWVVSYDGPKGRYDIPSALAIDNSGNVFVTGGCEVPGCGYDYATLKYTPNGEEAWITHFNGTGNDNDKATALTVDDAGNVYVTGHSIGSKTGNDFGTIKYSPEGDREWVVRYNGSRNCWDEATALTVDGSGNIYVTGKSLSPSTSYDYATVKYNEDGFQQWAARYNGPGNLLDYATAIAVDNSGNIYVTGYSKRSDTAYDYLTVGYSAVGLERWVDRYNGSGNFLDYPTAIAVDGSGNIYVTGYGKGLVTWYDYTTIKYDATGTRQWIARYHGLGNHEDRAFAMAVDTYGNVYVTGGSCGPGTLYDFATVSYNGDGDQQWVARYDGPGISEDAATALAIDDSGNTYVTGYSGNSETGHDYVTIKYTPDGLQEWVARYSGPGRGSDIPSAIAVGDSGCVHVTGMSEAAAASYDYATVKYSPDGVQEWVARYSGVGSTDDRATGLVVDGAGNVFVTGNSATIKYNCDGTEEWTTTGGISIAVDASENVYVVRNYRGSGWAMHATTKYVPSSVSVAAQEETE
ncbi:MAG: SBBP repeat-containing protein, partial [Gemmatimonadota bacterium]